MILTGLLKLTPLSVKRALLYGHARLCPICDSNLKFFLKSKNQPQAKCPICFSLKRHRFCWIFLNRKTNLFDGSPKNMLHFAPEPHLSPLFMKTWGIKYLSADLYNPRAMEKIDITKMPYSDASFHVLICSHVLEHVSDDRQAMAEIYRVLTAGGWTLIMVPLKGKHTVEDSTVVSESDRKRLFGQKDHVRQYGLDIIYRLQEVGLKVTVFRPEDIMSEEEIIQCSVKNELVFFCEKE